MTDKEPPRDQQVPSGRYPLLLFPPDLEKQYIQHYEEARLITSNRLVMTGLAVFSLFFILDYAAFPFSAAVGAWVIRAGTLIVVGATLFFAKFTGRKRLGYGTVSALVLLINAAVVAIDVIGSNSAGYTLTLGSLFVIIASCTLVRFPFWVSVVLAGLMAATQLCGMLFFMHLDAQRILINVLFYAFFIAMLLVSSYSTDSDSRRIFLLTFYRKKYEKSGLDQGTAAEHSTRLDDYMRREKPYLNADLTIDDVSKTLGIKRHHLTQIISESHGTNFHAYINAFRVADAEESLNSNSPDMTILRIAYDCGFNSKATFNRMFKKLTGVSPTEYRQGIRADRS